MPVISIHVLIFANIGEILKLLFWLSVLTLFINAAVYAAPADHVVLITIDGGKPAAIFKAQMPNLRRMMNEGAHSFTARTISPSLTLPSHVSMLTGVDPIKHGINWNFWNPLYGAVRVSTAFSIMKASGLGTAIFAAKDKFKHLNVPGSLDIFSIKNNDAFSVAAEASDYISNNLPAFAFIHLPDADYAGHSSGWDSSEQQRAFTKVDDAIGKIIQTVETAYAGKNFVVIVTADHGGSGRTHGSQSDEDSLIPWITWGNISRKNFPITKEIKTQDTAATSLWLLGIKIPDQWQGVPVEEPFAL